MRIAFVGPELLPWRTIDFTNLWDNPRGLTGTESSIACFARELVKRGHQVSIYYDEHPCSFDGVQMGKLSSLQADGAGFDVVCLWAFDPKDLRLPASVLRVYYSTGNSFDSYQPNFEDGIDLFLSPAEHHRQYMKKWTLTHSDKWEVMPLGCYVGDYVDGEKVPGRVVHTSSPDRGLHWVFQEWPHILEKVPHAKLRVFYYGLDDYVRNAIPADANHGIGLIEHGYRARYIGEAVKRLAGHGVTIVGATSRKQMAQELSEAMVLAYPVDTTAYSEGFSVSTLEGCASGALPVLVGTDAIGSIYGGHTPCVPPPAKKNLGEWRELVIRALTDERWRSGWVARARAFAEEHDYPLLAAKMEATFMRAIDRKRRAPAVSVNPKIALDVVMTPFMMGAATTVDPENYVEVSHGGGSLIGCLHLVHAMKRRGDYHVRTYGNFSRQVPDFLPLEHFDKHAPRDALFTFYDTTPLRDVNTGCLRIASHHTYLPPDLMFTSFADINTAPTEHAADFLRRAFHPSGTWYVLPNGVADPGVQWAPIDGRVLHHVSPDRGLPILLSSWPAIRARVPHATLHVIGDVAGAAWNDVALYPSFERTVQGRYIMALREGVRVAKAAGGVEFLGKVSRETLRMNLAHAACLAYPCAPSVPCETFSVSTMECMRAGVPVVLSPADALGFYDDIARVTPAPVREHVQEFVDEVCKMLLSKQRQMEANWRGRMFAQKYTHDRMATVLDQIIRKHLP